MALPKPFIHSISLFFPMYNEHESVVPMTRKTLEVLNSITSNFEIIIVDDGSKDGSSQLADQLVASDPRIRVIHHAQNMGYGQALRTGFASATKDIVMYTDCDEPVDLWKIPEALEYLQEHDMVIGYRTDRWEGWHRFLYSKVYNSLVRMLFGVRVRDINFSFKLVWRRKLKQFNLGAGSVFIDGELLAEAARLELDIHEMPIQYQMRTVGYSKFNAIKPAIDTFREIIAYSMRRTQQPARARVRS